MKKDKKIVKKSNSCIFLLLICIATCFMGIVYARIDILLGITGKLAAEPQEHIYITEVNLSSNNNAVLEESQINSFPQTVLDSSIVLSPTDVNSTITYEVKLYNSNNEDYCYVETLFEEEFYDNKNIEFEITGIEKGQIVSAKDYISLYITFKYVDGVDVAEDGFSNVLNSFLNFDFEKRMYPVLANKMVPVYYENNEWRKINSLSSTWFNYYDGKWANAINYNNQILFNQVNKFSEGKSFDGVSDFISLGSKNYNFGKKISIASRFKINEYGTSTQIIVGNPESGGFYLGLTSGNKIRLKLFLEDGTELSVTSSKKAQLDTWYNVAATYDGSLVKLYINGILEDSTACTLNIMKSAAPIVIGGNPNVDGAITAAWFKGTIAEVIVMREVLEELEIIEEYGKEIKHNPSNNNTLYFLKFDGDNGITCNGAQYTDEGIVFDGVDDYVSVGYSLYDFKNTFTIGARFKLDSYSDEEYTIFGNPQTAGMNLFKSTTNEIVFAIYDETIASYINKTFISTPELNTWYTIMATYDGTTLKLYLNGNNVVSEKVQITTVPSKPEFMIGVNTTVNSKLGGGYFDGVISDVILIDEAISAKDISENYSSKLNTVISDKTLISYDLRGYEGREDGSIIPEEMIDMMWVWIPRFNAETPTNLEKIKLELIDIDEEAHDAFEFGEDKIKGFWIGKFENSTNFNSENLDNIIYIKPNKNSWINNSLKSMFNSIKNIENNKDKYGFDVNETKNLDFHLVKNNEWGAVSYFTHSKCGISRDRSYIDVAINDFDFTGGLSYKDNIEQSTTGNIYGVYDMVGGTNEFVMANYNDTITSSFDVLPDKKYYNLYTNEENYNINKLQHAVFETNSLFNNNSNNFINENNPWMIRKDLFSYDVANGDANIINGSRIVLIIK